jgi:dolichyl-phosphate-mannose-protein mannosyltransferase
LFFLFYAAIHISQMYVQSCVSRGYVCSQFFPLNQYSYYGGNIVPTPQRSDSPVTTIGGEPGGRAAVVVGDANADIGADAGASEHTSVAAAGMPEPGRDIFAGESVQDITTGGGGAPPPEPEGQREKHQKVVSEVQTGPVSNGRQEQEMGGGTMAGSAAAASSVGGDAAAGSEMQTPGKEKGPTGGGAMEGPLGEAEAVADRVAKELYPDAHKR